MKRISLFLYIIVFLSVYSYIDYHQYDSIEPLGSIWRGIFEIIGERQSTTIIIGLMIIVVMYILLDKLLKKLD